jgi:hypothetical protein
MKDGTSTATPFGHFLHEVSGENAATRCRVPSTPVPRSMWPRLLRSVVPEKNESLRSISYRTCALNDLPNSWGLLKQMGLLHRNRVTLAEDASIDLERLAHAMRVPDDAVLHRRYADLGNGHLSFFGLDVPASVIENRIRRFSPAAFVSDAKRRTDPSDMAYAYHRSIWELRPIPFCLDNWDMLHDTCWCEQNGVVQGWTRTATHLHLCDQCGDPLSDAGSIDVPHDMRPALSVLTAVVHPDEERRAAAAGILPEAIRHADRSRIFHLILRIAQIVDPYSADHPIELPRERLHGIWSACQAVTRWPLGFESLEFHEDLSPHAVPHVHKLWGNLSDREHKVATDRHDARRSTKSQHVTLLGIRPATELARLSPETLLWAHDAGLVTQHSRIHGGRMLPAFAAEDLIRFGDDWRTRIDPVSLSDEWNIPFNGIEQCVALGILIADAPAMPGTGPHFYPEAVEGFIDAIEAAAVSVGNDAEGRFSIPLTRVMRSIHGRAKPWGPVLESLLDRSLPFAIQSGKNLADSILISESDEDLARSASFDRSASSFPFCETFVQREALDLLNLHQRHRKVLDRLRTVGVNPKRYYIADVEALGLELENQAK